MKVITNGEELIGKVIRYCNISDGMTGNVIVCTEDKSILMGRLEAYDEYGDGSIGIHNEREVKRIIALSENIQELLVSIGFLKHMDVHHLVTEYEEEVQRINAEIKANSKERRYKEYLALKEEFEKEE